MVVLLGIVSCSDNPYTGSMLQPSDLDKYLSQVGGKVCLINGSESVCVALYPKRGDRVLPTIHIHPSSTTYLFYYKGQLIIQAERVSDNTDLIDEIKGDGQDESDRGPRDDVGGGQQPPDNIGGGEGQQPPGNIGGGEGQQQTVNNGGTRNGGTNNGENNGNTNNGGNNGNPNNGENNGDNNNGGSNNNNGGTNNGGNNGDNNNGGSNTNNGGSNGNTNNGGNNGNTNNGENNGNNGGSNGNNNNGNNGENNNGNNNGGGNNGNNNGGGNNGNNNNGGSNGNNNGGGNNGGSNGNTKNGGGSNGDLNNRGNNNGENNGDPKNDNANNGGTNDNTKNDGTNNDGTNNGRNNGGNNNGGNNNNNGGVTPLNNPNPSQHNPPGNVQSHLVYGHADDNPEHRRGDGWLVWIFYPHNYVEQGHPRGLGIDPFSPQSGPVSEDDPITTDRREDYGFTFSVSGGEVKNFVQTSGSCSDDDNNNRDDNDGTPCSSSGSDYSVQMFVKSSADKLTITIRWTHGTYAPNSQTFNIMKEINMREYDADPPPDPGHTNQNRWD